MNSDNKNESNDYLRFDKDKLLDIWLKKKKENYEDEEKNIRTNNVIKVAAFCFSIISWYATSNGLKKYIFNDANSDGGIQAYLLSFAIQSILFALSINFVNFIDFKKKKIQSLLPILLYIALLTTSSTFSYVYISNKIYSETKYVDANMYLDSCFRNIVYNTDLYIDEYKKYLLYSIGEDTKELAQILNDEGLGDVSQEEIDDIENELFTLKTDYEIKEIDMNSKKQVMDDWGESLRDNSWKSEERKQEIKDMYDAAVKNYEMAVSEYSNAKSLYEEKNSILEEKKLEFEKSFTGIVNALFSEALSTNVSVDDLDKYATQISFKLNELEKNINNSENFNSIIEYIRNITQNISYYKDLVCIESEYIDKIIDDSESVIVPKNQKGDNYDTYVVEWGKYWNQKYSDLEDNIKNLPVFYSENGKRYSEVNNEILENYNINDIINNMDEYERKYIEDINEIEQAFNYLTNKYRIMAWFSLIFSVFMDMSALLAGFAINLKKE